MQHDHRRAHTETAQLFLRNKFACPERGFQTYQYGRIRMRAALIIGFSIELNWLEAIDFFAGWLQFDPLADDRYSIYERLAREHSPGLRFDRPPDRGDGACVRKARLRKFFAPQAKSAATSAKPIGNTKGATIATALWPSGIVGRPIARAPMTMLAANRGNVKRMKPIAPLFPARISQKPPARAIRVVIFATAAAMTRACMFCSVLRLGLLFVIVKSFPYQTRALVHQGIGIEFLIGVFYSQANHGR